MHDTSKGIHSSETIISRKDFDVFIGNLLLKIIGCDEDMYSHRLKLLNEKINVKVKSS